MKSLITRSFSTTFLAAGLAACAVTEIDVDVYKGPLANHEDVQVQQFAAMAIGAKPLLIQLRDILEWGDDFEAILANTSPYSTLPRRPEWYDAKHIPPAPDGAVRLTDVQALRVNGILHLYEDTLNPQIQPFVQRGTAALESIRRLSPVALGDKIRDARDWELIAPHLVKNESTKSLIEAWMPFLYPASLGDEAPPFRPLGCVIKAYDMPSIKIIATRLQRRTNNGSVDACDLVKNASWRDDFAMLKSPTVVQEHAEKLFIDSRQPSLSIDTASQETREAMALFTTKVQRAVAAYFAMRTSIEEIWTTALDAFDYINSIPIRNLAQAGGKEAEEKLKSLEPLAAELIAELTRTRYLLYFLWYEGDDEKTKALRDELRQALRVSDAFHPVVWAKPRCGARVDSSSLSIGDRASAKAFLDEYNHPPLWLRERTGNQGWYDRANLFLATELLSRKTEMTALLRNVHAWYKNNPSGDLIIGAKDSNDEDGTSCGKITLSLPDPAFGIASDINGGFFSSSNALVGRVEQLTNRIASGAAVGLEGGRLPEGLETLIKDYVTATAKRNEAPAAHAQEVNHHKSRLEGALIRFAQKVLFIANNSVLLQGRSGPGGKESQQVHKYTRMLQAVGNSILIQGDELAHRKQHAAQQVSASGSEREAFEAILQDNASNFFENLVADLAKQKAALETQKTELEAIKSALQTEIDVRTTIDENNVQGISLEAALALGLESDPLDLPEALGKALAAINEDLTKSDAFGGATTVTSENVLNVVKLTVAKQFQAQATVIQAVSINGGAVTKSSSARLKALKTAKEWLDCLPATLPDISAATDNAQRLSALSDWIRNMVSIPPDNFDSADLAQYPACLQTIKSSGASSQWQVDKQTTLDLLEETSQDLPAEKGGGALRALTPLLLPENVQDQDSGQKFHQDYLAQVRQQEFEGALIMKNMAANGGLASFALRQRQQRLHGTIIVLSALPTGEFSELDSLAADLKRTEYERIIRSRMSAYFATAAQKTDELAAAAAQRRELLRSAIRSELLPVTAESEDPDDLSERIDRLVDAVSVIGDAVSILEALPDEVTQKLQRKFSATSGLAHIIEYLEGEKSKAGSNTKSIESTIKILSEFNPAYESALVDKIPVAGSTVETWDQMIALLRHEEVQATRIYGESHERTRRIRQAIAAAYEHRSGMVYIRPSAAYLRSSYPATALQEDPELGFASMLNQHALRSLPLIGPLFGSGLNEDLKIQSEIDKQFWQTINKVKVSGAGNTNYVIAKDDIGNWYVKGYSANPDEIIKSARNLALFNIGNQVGSDLLSQTLAEDEGEAGGAGGGPQQTRLQRLHSDFLKHYIESTGSDYGEIILDLTPTPLDSASAEERIVRQIRSVIDDRDCYEDDSGCGGIALKSALDGAISANLLSTARQEMEIAVAAVSNETDGARLDLVAREQASQIVSGLQASRRFYDLFRQIANQPAISADPVDDGKARARSNTLQVVQESVQTYLRGRLQKRQELVSEYERSVLFLGRAVNPQQSSMRTMGRVSPPG